jgi:hypothetical protein
LEGSTRRAESRLKLSAPSPTLRLWSHSARAAGAVGERYDGYVGVAAAVSTAVRSQVASINIRRRALYSRLAASRGASPQDVGITAGCKLLARMGVGEAYMMGDGVWRAGGGTARARARLLPVSFDRG